MLNNLRFVPVYNIMVLDPFYPQAKGMPVAGPSSRASQVSFLIIFAMESTPLTKTSNMLVGGLLEKMNRLVSVLRRNQL